MILKEHYKKIIESTHQSLKNAGFVKNGNTFRISSDESRGVINFQKSTKSTVDSITFTINLGVASKRLLKIYNPKQIENPDIWDCHWQVRIGHLLPDNKDIWWTILAETNVDQLAQDIQKYTIKLGIPEIQKYLSDGALRDLWLTDKSPSLTKVQRLKYLAELMK